ncbi:MAG TPA: IS1182 family transposase [Candidatus Acidoferrum sp.]|jgi:transposase|nr:IS1182 family transposase [Candidatus Acidoferrum sp.]
MGQNFYPDAINQTLLFPPSLHDWLPDGHLARFVADVVAALDLDSIYKSYQEKDGRGQAAYAPEMMVRLLLYGYATGVYSSRKIQTRTLEDIAFRYLSGDYHPDHATIAEFRKRHLDALSGLFTQALLLCAEAGLVKLGHVSIDGTKIKANASKHKAMSYKRMNETEARLKQEIDALLSEAEKTDAEEDSLHGKDRHGDELPVELQRRESRLQKIREAKAALEQEAQEKAAQKRADVEQQLSERKEEERRTGKKKRGRKPQLPDPEQARPDDTAQHNFTDAESRIMPDGANKGSFVQGYNAQIAVDSASQVIVAAEITQETNDKQQLLPMIAQIVTNLEQKPEKVSADTGYFSEANVTDASAKDVDLYVATGRDKHGYAVETNSAPPPSDASPKEAMREKLRTAAGRAVYKMRKAIVEPVFAQIKEQRGFRRFSLRGQQNVRREWRLVCAVSNLLKLFRAGWDLEMA